jgi:hypothetical protein
VLVKIEAEAPTKTPSMTQEETIAMLKAEATLPDVAREG